MASCSTSSAVAELRGVDGGGFCDSFRLGPPLGEGSTSLVLQALASDGSRRALKLALRSSMASNGWSRAVRILHRESLILKQMGAHEHIAGWCDWFASSNAVAIMLELGEGGDFQQALRAHGPLDELMLRPVVRQLCSALAHLHSQQFVHRDVKLENLLCSDAAWPPSRLLLCDFGHACAISDAEADREFLGTPGYAPPEVIKGPSWSYCADLFSCGVVIYALIADTLPIVCWPDGAEGPPDISGRAWWSVSVEAKLLLLALLSIDPNERPGVEAVRRGSWLESAAAGTSHAVPRGYSEPLLDASRHACTEIAKNDGREDTEGARPAEPPLGRVISAHGLSLSALSIASTTTADSVAGRRVPLSQMHSRSCGDLEDVGSPGACESTKMQMDRLARMREAMRRCQAHGRYSELSVATTLLSDRATSIPHAPPKGDSMRSMTPQAARPLRASENTAPSVSPVQLQASVLLDAVT